MTASRAGCRADRISFGVVVDLRAGRS